MIRVTARSCITTLTRSLAIGSMLGVLIAGPVLAQANDPWTSGSSYRGHDYVNTGGYMVIGGLTAFETFQNDFGQQFDTSFGFVLKGGARLNPFLALEVEGNFISGFDTLVNISNNPNFPGSGLPPVVGLTVDGGNIMGNVVAYLPLGRIQPKAIVGLGGMWARLRSTNQVGVVCGPSFYYYWYCTGAYAQLGSTGGFVMQFGGGVDVVLGDNWALVIESTYVKPFGSIEDLTYVNLNWGVRFDF